MSGTWIRGRGRNSGKHFLINAADEVEGYVAAVGSDDPEMYFEAVYGGDPALGNGVAILETTSLIEAQDALMAFATEVAAGGHRELIGGVNR